MERVWNQPNISCVAEIYLCVRTLTWSTISTYIHTYVHTYMINMINMIISTIYYVTVLINSRFAGSWPCLTLSAELSTGFIASTEGQDLVRYDWRMTGTGPVQTSEVRGLSFISARPRVMPSQSIVFT